MVRRIHINQLLKRYLDRFGLYCRARERDQQTDTQTDRPRYSVFCTEYMRCGLITVKRLVL